MDPSRYRQLSLIIKLLLMLIILIVSVTATCLSVSYMITGWFSYAKDSESMEYAFILLGFLAFILCIATSILSCCGLHKPNRNSKSIPITDIVFCVVAALLLLLAGLLLIIAAHNLCNYDRVLEFERKGADQLGRILGRLKGYETDGLTVGNKRPKDGNTDTTEEDTTYDYTPEEARKFFNENCPRYWAVSPKTIAGSTAIVVSLLFLLLIGLDVKQIREKPTAEEGVEEAFGAPTGEPSVVYPNYYAAPPPEYQPQNASYVYYVPPLPQPQNGGVTYGPPVSQNFVKSSGGGGPQMSPSQNPQAAPPGDSR